MNKAAQLFASVILLVAISDTSGRSCFKCMDVWNLNDEYDKAAAEQYGDVSCRNPDDTEISVIPQDDCGPAENCYNEIARSVEGGSRTWIKRGCKTWYHNRSGCQATNSYLPPEIFVDATRNYTCTCLCKNDACNSDRLDVLNDHCKKKYELQPSESEDKAPTTPPPTTVTTDPGRKCYQCMDAWLPNGEYWDNYTHFDGAEACRKPGEYHISNKPRGDCGPEEMCYAETSHITKDNGITLTGIIRGCHTTQHNRTGCRNKQVPQVFGVTYNFTCLCECHGYGCNDDRLNVVDQDCNRQDGLEEEEPSTHPPRARKRNDAVSGLRLDCCQLVALLLIIVLHFSI